MFRQQGMLLGAMAMALAVNANAAGDGPNKRHLEQSVIDSGALSLQEIVRHGRHIFADDFNVHDGFGDPNRPGINSVGEATGFNRVSGPDSVACAACHNKPFVGGAGDNSVNIFPGFNRPDNIDELAFDNLNVRNSQSIFGAGPKQVLALEMIAELEATADEARQQAEDSGVEVTLPLFAKGVSFGSITGLPDGTLNTDGVEGVAKDLRIRPFNTAGVIPTLRDFVIGASEQHFGIEAEEQFGVDGDGDGITRELTEGDVTASALFQASLPIPVQILPKDRRLRREALRGERVFGDIGCTSCHISEMVIDDPVFRERAPSSVRSTNLDLTRDSFFPRLRRNRNGSANVRLYSDLKRHDLGAAVAEPLLQVDRASVSHFMTLPLWGVASTGPWMHDGRATTLTDAISLHGGEAAAVRDAYTALNERDRDAVIEFLKTQQVVVLDPRLLIPNLPLPEQFDVNQANFGQEESYLDLARQNP